MHIARDRPLGGSGAGTYAVARLRYRTDATQASEPHSVAFQVLGDLGVVGLVLLAATVVGAVLGIRRGLRLVDPADRRAAAALAALVLAFGVHALVDYDLDFLAVSAPTLTALGGLLALGRPRAGVHARAPELVALGAATRPPWSRSPSPRSPTTRCSDHSTPPTPGGSRTPFTRPTTPAC